jgi:hypothetical protein
LREDSSDGQDSSEIKNLRPSYLVSEFSLVTALVFFTFINLLYATNKSEFQTSGESPFYPDLTLSLLIIGTALLSLTVISFLRVEVRRPVHVGANSRITESLGAIIGNSIIWNRRLVVLVALVYGTVFAFLDGILIYQPTVNFATVYGVTSTSSIVENCCGPPGYVPVGLAYFPAQHVGIQLIPISILTMVLVSLLVGVNAALLFESVKDSRPLKQRINTPIAPGNTPFLGGAIGAVFGVFAGCPTCAAAFFLSMIAGSGATVFSLTISEFQPVIVLISIPLLVGSIVWQSRSIRTILQGCAV